MAVFPALFGLLLAALVSEHKITLDTLSALNEELIKELILPIGDKVHFIKKVSRLEKVGRYSTSQTVDISPREAVRRIGDELIVLCKVPYEIDSCRMTVGKQSYRLHPNIQDGDVVYTGHGLQAGECGAHIRHVKEEWNGEITCTLPPQSGNIEVTATMKLIVARAPEPPTLLAPEQPVFREGDRFEAQCEARNGRPAAKLSWLIDDQPLLEGLHQPKIETDPETGLSTIRQNLTRVLVADDAGRRLACRAEHEALTAPREASRQLAITYPPRPIDGESKELTIFGLTLGEEGIVNVTIRAAPAPAAEWRFSDVRLPAGGSTPDGAATALHPAPLGAGYYNVSLVLRPVVKEHVDQTFHLLLTNDLGQETFVVHISTLDEPAGVQLDTGAIVGIVVAVLVLIIAVSLIVFAKATDRWCFAGGRGREHKNSGESDTESAAGGARTARSERSRLSALSARVRAALPRAKDKVKDAEQPQDAEEKLAEEKKGVVYAELALGEQNQGDKPPPPAAEYAEIVYTDQQKETKE